MKVTKRALAPTKLTDAGVWQLAIEEVPLPEGFICRHQQIVSIPPGGWGANHKHPRQEVFLAVSGNLVIIWEDEEGKHSEAMGPKDGTSLQLFFIPPYIPHAIVNKRKIPAIMYEWADAKQHDVERVHLL